MAELFEEEEVNRARVSFEGKREIVYIFFLSAEQ